MWKQGFKGTAVLGSLPVCLALVWNPCREGQPSSLRGYKGVLEAVGDPRAEWSCSMLVETEKPSQKPAIRNLSLGNPTITQTGVSAA